MKTSELLQKAFELLLLPGAHTKRAPARAAELEVVHALHPDAVSWDCVGAVQKVQGEMDGIEVENAIKCLRIGAMKIRRDLGVLEVNDDGSPDDLQAMFAFAIQTANVVEQEAAQAA